MSFKGALLVLLILSMLLLEACRADSQFIEYGSYQNVVTTLPIQQENYQGTPTSLPTTEPGAGSEQITYIVQESDLPVIEPTPDSVKYVALIHAAGHFTTAGICYYRMKKNGVSVSQSSSYTSANMYYTRMFCFYDVQIGDVLKVSLWSQRADSDWDYNASVVYPTRLIPFNSTRFFAEVTYVTFEGYSLTQGNPIQKNIATPYLFHDDHTLSGSPWDGYTLEILYNGAVNDYGFYRLIHGDYANDDGSPTPFTDATYHPAYWQERAATNITYRLMALGNLTGNATVNDVLKDQTFYAANLTQLTGALEAAGEGGIELEEAIGVAIIVGIVAVVAAASVMKKKRL